MNKMIHYWIVNGPNLGIGTEHLYNLFKESTEVIPHTDVLVVLGPVFADVGDDLLSHDDFLRNRSSCRKILILPKTDHAPIREYYNLGWDMALYSLTLPYLGLEIELTHTAYQQNSLDYVVCSESRSESSGIVAFTSHTPKRLEDIIKGHRS